TRFDDRVVGHPRVARTKQHERRSARRENDQGEGQPIEKRFSKNPLHAAGLRGPTDLTLVFAAGVLMVTRWRFLPPCPRPESPPRACSAPSNRRASCATGRSCSRRWASPTWCGTRRRGGSSS